MIPNTLQKRAYIGLKQPEPGPPQVFWRTRRPGPEGSYSNKQLSLMPRVSVFVSIHNPPTGIEPNEKIEGALSLFTGVRFKTSAEDFFKADVLMSLPLELDAAHETSFCPKHNMSTHLLSVETVPVLKSFYAMKTIMQLPWEIFEATQNMFGLRLPRETMGLEIKKSPFGHFMTALSSVPLEGLGDFLADALKGFGAYDAKRTPSAIAQIFKEDAQACDGFGRPISLKESQITIFCYTVQVITQSGEPAIQLPPFSSN